jgi:hypothetical protein
MQLTKVIPVYHKNSNVIHNSLLCIIGETQSTKDLPGKSNNQKKKETLYRTISSIEDE